MHGDAMYTRRLQPPRFNSPVCWLTCTASGAACSNLFRVLQDVLWPKRKQPSYELVLAEPFRGSFRAIGFLQGPCADVDRGGLGWSGEPFGIY